ncbi:MAG TPA: ATP-dependent DNA helicase [Acidimicrobiales bacterium]|nr:ATP-dependent DNA helicase [Acidimicrobiales bacterium]
MPDVADALARVRAALPAGEERPGQVAMAEAVAKGIDAGRHLVVQAGTGTGKSLGYLVPAILSGKRVVVATATKALQDQLAGKDLPFLAEHLGLPFSFAVLKGRSNYLCVQKASEIAKGSDQLTMEELTEGAGALGKEVLRVVDWIRETATGDRADLPFEPRPKVWSLLSVGATECPGAAKCPSGEECFAERARQRAQDADVVVVNTHLYGAHLASGGYVLPEHDVVVFDEAHELEDVAASSLGVELGGGRLRALARMARPLVSKDEAGVLDALEDAAARLEEAMNPWRDKRVPAELDDALLAAVALATERVARATSAVRQSEDDGTGKPRALQAAGHLAGDLHVCASVPDGFVAWVEVRSGSPLLRVAPVDVGEVLSTRLWAEKTAVLTSATIPLRLAARLGIDTDRCDELDVGSPFPFADHGLLYCPVHLPDPRRPEYQAAMHEELWELIKLAGGRTLALFTSWRAMQAAVDAVRPCVPWPVLAQGDLPKPALVDAFSEDEHASLFATMGYWQGIDVPGPSLSLVAIDRIPFPRPDEPLFQARRERAGPRAFGLVDLPRAATLLAQGAGRLIRTATDRGVVAVLDPRLGSANYRWDLVRALPPMRRTRHRADVEAFLHEALAP